MSGRYTYDYERPFYDHEYCLSLLGLNCLDQLDWRWQFFSSFRLHTRLSFYDDLALPEFYLIGCSSGTNVPPSLKLWDQMTFFMGPIWGNFHKIQRIMCTKNLGNYENTPQNLTHTLSEIGLAFSCVHVVPHLSTMWYHLPKFGEIWRKNSS